MTGKLSSSYQRVDDILRMLRRIHSDMSHLCRAASGESRDGMLAGTFARRQDAMAEFVGDSLHDLDDELRRTWVQYVPTDQIERLLDNLQADAAHPERIALEIVELQNEIRGMLEVVRGEVPSAELAEFIGALSQREFAEAKSSAEALRDNEV
jgi:hypothetical protein